MKWNRGAARSGNLEDRRGQGGFGGGGLGGMLGGGRGGGMGLPIPTSGKMIIPFLLLLVLGTCLGGGNILGGGGGGGGSGYDVGTGMNGMPAAPAAEGDGIPRSQDADAEAVDFVSFVLDDVQTTWTDIFQKAGKQYQPAEMVIFEGATQTQCGVGQEQTGPFYCPLDRKAYMDMDFFRELKSKFGAPGDFAQAYVIAHELGHHVQNLTGVNSRVRQLQERNPDDANDLSVRQELQADCFAGVWAYSTYRRGILEDGDLQEGLDAAAAVGDDRLQRQAGARVNPESWTHGSSKQRMDWFSKGYENGDPDACDTFSGDI